MLMVFIIGFIMIIGIEKYDYDKKVRDADNDPFNTVKSDRWKREHGEL